MERVKFVNHKGKNILLLDFSNCSCEEVLRIIEESRKLIKVQPEHSLLTLTNVEGAHFDFKVVEAMKDFTVHNKPYVRKGAVVGVTGLRKIIYDAVMRFSGRNLPSFDDIEEARDWLVED